MKAQITGVAHYLPPRIVDNVEIAKRYPKAGTPEDIFTKTGILERRYSDELTTSGMAIQAVKILLEKTNTNPEDIDCILLGTLTQDRFFDDNRKVLNANRADHDFTPDAVRVIKAIGAKNAHGYDIINACPSFLTALKIANFVECREGRKIVVCGADRMTKTLDGFNYKTGILFGDAAAAVLLEGISSEKSGIVNMHAKTSSGCQDVYFSSPYIIENWEDAKFELDGQKVYRHGVTLSVQVINEYFNKSGTTTSDFKYIIPHQANIRMLREMAQQLEVPLEKFLINIDKVGNTAGASIPLCLSQKVDEGRISKGDRLLLVSFGAGYALEVIDLYF